MPYQRLAIELKFAGIREYTICLALRQARYKRYVAFRKPLVLEKNRQLHLEFALEHINQIDKQQDTILQLDETQVILGSYQKIQVTRKEDEALDLTYILWQKQGGGEKILRGLMTKADLT